MGNGVGWEQAVWHSTIRLSYSWAHQVCPRQPIYFDCKNFLQLWCVLYRNAIPYRPAVCNQPYLHTQADEELEKIPGTEIFNYSRNYWNAWHPCEVRKGLSAKGVFQWWIHSIAQLQVQSQTNTICTIFIEPVELSAEKIHQLSEQHRKYIKQDIPHYIVPTFSRVLLRITLWLLTHSRKRKGSVLSLGVTDLDMWTQQGSIISLRRTAPWQSRNLVTRPYTRIQEPSM